METERYVPSIRLEKYNVEKQFIKDSLFPLIKDILPPLLTNYLIDDVFEVFREKMCFETRYVVILHERSCHFHHDASAMSCLNKEDAIRVLSAYEEPEKMIVKIDKRERDILMSRYYSKELKKDILEAVWCGNVSKELCEKMKLERDKKEYDWISICGQIFFE